MSEPFVFDPRCGICKEPFGAAVCGQAVTFHCRPLASEGFTYCAVVLHHEFANTDQEVAFSPAGDAGDRVCFTGTVSAPEEPELSWYHFRFWRDDGSGCILDRTGYRSDGGVDPWQLTCYRDTPAPAWFGGGVTYQIFPDRFCRLSVPDPEGLVGDRLVHEHWNERPEWRPDDKGIIWNKDFFGGSLAGIASKLEDLAAMGVTTLYLNPVFEAASNHRYNTADYKKIDPMLGTEEGFRRLCAKAHDLGMKVILDGVFNHTGSQSLYFNADGFYPSLGAAQSPDSPYYDWFSFHPWPSDYDAWWGIDTLPAVREDDPSYVNFIIDDEDSVIRRWLRLGADGWRLDVADELPDWFIEKIRAAMDETKPGSLLIGEVWEDASTKIAYSKRRKYLLGSELHGVMNYPFRNALLAYLLGGDAAAFLDAMETLRENYPPAAFYSAMNFLGTHDTPRILTVLGADRVPQSRDERAVYRLSVAERHRGVALVKLAALILFTFPGAPTVYYGDEAGMEGFEDPFNRGTYPWGKEDRALKDWFTRMGRLRKRHPALRSGVLNWLRAEGPLLAYAREWRRERAVTAVNTSMEVQTLTLPWHSETAMDHLSGQVLYPQAGSLTVEVPPRGAAFLT